jgi:integrase
MARRKDNKNRVLKEGEYQRTNGTYEYKWTDKSGKRHSISCKTLEGLRKKENDVIKDTIDGINNAGDITINDLYRKWIDTKRGVKITTLSNYDNMYSRYVAKTFGNTRIDNLKRSDVKRFYNKLIDEYGYSVRTVDCIHTILHQVLNFGVDDEYLRYNPSDNAMKELKRTHNNTKNKKRALTIPEQLAFEDFLKLQTRFKRFYPIYITMLYTGMRVGEAIGLRWCDIDYENNTISVNHTISYNKIMNGDSFQSIVSTPKTKAGVREIPMLPQVREALEIEKEYQNEIGVECKCKIGDYSDFVFLNTSGNIQRAEDLNRVLRDITKIYNEKYAVDDILLPHMNNHILRHTFATRLCESGMNIKTIQYILGHSNIAVTMDIYTDVTEDFKKKEMNDFHEYLLNVCDK